MWETGDVGLVQSDRSRAEEHSSVCVCESISHIG